MNAMIHVERTIIKENREDKASSKLKCVDGYHKAICMRPSENHRPKTERNQNQKSM